MKISRYGRVLLQCLLLLAVAIISPAAAQTPDSARPAPLALVPSEHVWASTEVASGRDGFPYIYAFHTTADKATAGYCRSFRNIVRRLPTARHEVSKTKSLASRRALRLFLNVVVSSAYMGFRLGRISSASRR